MHPDAPERDSALLTKKQREYLRGDSEIEPGSSHERAMRGRIRERLYNSLDDFSIVWTGIETRDTQAIFEKADTFNMANSAFSFLFNGLSLASRLAESDTAGEESAIKYFDETLDMYASYVEKAVEEVYVRRGYRVDNVDVDISVELGDDLNELAQGDLERLSREELFDLVKTGKIDYDEFHEIIDWQPVDPEEIRRHMSDEN